MKVTVRKVSDFVAEVLRVRSMANDGYKIFENCVRAMAYAEPVSMDAYTIVVVATAVVVNPSQHLYCVELLQPIGTDTKPDGEVMQAAEEGLQTLHQRLEGSGIDILGGAWELDDGR